MIDTMNIYLPIKEGGGVDFLEETPTYLSPDSLGEWSKGGHYGVTGWVDNLKVSITERGARVENSLCKYALGDNFQTLTRKAIQEAFERLADTLHLPLWRAYVSRIDVGTNIILRHPVDVYLNHLGRWRGIAGGRQASTLYYHTKGNGKTLCFYDKEREQKKKGEAIPELYSGRNVLRYEARYSKRLPALFKVKELRAETLYNETFYTALLDRWRDDYLAIDKINDVIPNFDIMKGKKELYKAGVITLAESYGGKVEFLTHIDEARKRGELERKQAHDLRQAVNEAYSLTGGLTVANEDMEELTKKVKEAVRYHR